jgi:uncharacterized protein involved in exopolysaccharide biosynthesis/Mrp family chromosome partitioning ATPase
MDAILTRPWRQTAEQQQQASAEQRREYISVADVSAFLKQHMLAIGACLGLGLFGAWFYAATTDPIYQAVTQILIEPKLPQLLQQQGTEVNTSLDTAQVESQIAVMQSEKIAQMVINALDLSNDPKFNRSRTPTLKERLTKFKSMLLSFVGIHAKVKEKAPTDVAVNNDPDASDLSLFERGRRTMWIFQEALDIRRVGVSYAINISFRSQDPDESAKIANAMADAFIREQLETKAAAAREGGNWLEHRLKELREQMNTATQIAQQFRAKHDYRVDQQANATSDEAGRVGGPTLEELEVTAETYRRMYESFLQAYASSVSQQSYPVADARVITAATRPLAPSGPRSKLVLAIGLIAGLMSGIGVAFLRHTLDRSVRSPRQVREDLGLECIGELPAVSGRRGGFARLDEVARSPQSRFSESLRSVKTAISLADSGHPIRSIGVTSALPGEGKSLCASNLAMLYVRYGMRTLVIDADTFHSALSEGFGANTDAERKADRDDSIRKHIKFVTAFGFDLLPSGVIESRSLLATKNMEGLLADLHDYDIIIVDMPPLTSGADRLAISSLLDGVIVAVEWGKTPAGLVTELARTLQASKASLIGVLLTKVRFMSTPRYRRIGALLPR